MRPSISWPGLRRGGQRQAVQPGDVVAQAVGRKGVDAHHHGGAVVLAAAVFGAHRQTGGGVLGVGFGLQDLADAAVAELPHTPSLIRAKTSPGSRSPSA